MSEDPEIVFADETDNTLSDFAKTDPAAQPSKEPTATERFKAELSRYPTEVEALKHIKDIAKKIGCTRGVGYNVIKKMTFSGDPPQLNSTEATIGYGTPDTVEVEAEAEATTDPEPTEHNFTPETLPQPQPDPLSYAQASPFQAKLQPVMERATNRTLTQILTLLGSSDGAGKALTDEESKDTAILLPYIIGRFTGKSGMTDRQYLDMTALTHVAGIGLKVLNKKRERKTIIPQEPKQPPAPRQDTPKPETKTAETPPATEPMQPKQTADGTPQYLQKL